MDNRWVETLQLILLFCCLGISIAMLGPSLPDLAYNTETSLKKYNIVFFCRAFGTLSGMGIDFLLFSRSRPILADPQLKVSWFPDSVNLPKKKFHWNRHNNGRLFGGSFQLLLLFTLCRFCPCCVLLLYSFYK